MEKHKKESRTAYKNPCARFLLWILACSATSLLALLFAFTVWTLLSYHSTVISLQERVETLEKQCSNTQDIVEQYIETNLEELVKKVSWTLLNCQC